MEKVQEKTHTLLNPGAQKNSSLSSAVTMLASFPRQDPQDMTSFPRVHSNLLPTSLATRKGKGHILPKSIKMSLLHTELLTIPRATEEVSSSQTTWTAVGVPQRGIEAFWPEEKQIAVGAAYIMCAITKQQRFIISVFWRLSDQGVSLVGSGEVSLPGLQTAGFLLSLPMANGDS